MSHLTINESCQFQEENCKTAPEQNQPQPTYFNQQLNFSLLQSLTLPLNQVRLQDKQTILHFSSEQDYQTIKAELESFFQKNLNENVFITPTSELNEIAIEFTNESTSNYIYNSLKNELELLSLIDSNENVDDKDNISSLADYNDDSNQLQEIIKKKQYKEYQPIKSRMNFYQTVKFNTHSFRDYQKKYVSQYFVQIENDKDFQVTKILIGNNGVLLRKIIFDNCIYYNDYSTKIRLRGKGSGYKEGPNNEESNDPLELCVSSLNFASFMRCCFHIENILRNIYYQYYLYQCKVNFLNKNPERPILKKIMKYQYVVNRTTNETKN